MRRWFHRRHGVTDLSRKARANRANNVILVSAAALFVAAVGAARIAHPARASQPATTSSSSEHGLGVHELLGPALRRRVGRRRLLRLRLDRAVAVGAAALDRRLVNAHRFVSMGCDVVVGGATAAERRAIERLFADRDRMFSRFRPDSELNRVNRASGSVVQVSAPFAEMVELALRAARQTDGLVDPTLGAAIEAAGYDRDFSELTPSADAAEPGARGRWRSSATAPDRSCTGRTASSST